MVRWVSRLTEFLRTTAARGADGMDRVMEDIGLTKPLSSSRRTPPRQASLTVMRQQVVFGGQENQRAIEMSPLKS